MMATSTALVDFGIAGRFPVRVRGEAMPDEAIKLG
jgi:hypothetical protein